MYDEDGFAETTLTFFRTNSSAFISSEYLNAFNL